MVYITLTFTTTLLCVIPQCGLVNTPAKFASYSFINVGKCGRKNVHVSAEQLVWSESTANRENKILYSRLSWENFTVILELLLYPDGELLGSAA